MALPRARIGLYAIGGVATVALAISVFILAAAGTPVATAMVAAMPPSLLLGVLGLASRYLCRSMPLRSASGTRIAVAHGGSALAASALWVATWQWWLDKIHRQINVDISLLFAVGVLMYAATVAVHYLIMEIDAASDAEEAALRYQVLAREAELKAFKAQVDPHFLFNSLNAVASLCGSRPQDARRMAQLLADFFRLSLRLGAQERITLRDEMDIVSRYLEIEKVRFGERLELKIDVDDEAGACLVPPLLLQPLVENAVRHGIASMIDGGSIDIAAHVRDGVLRIQIDNPTDPDRAHNRGEGIGIENARGRLSGVSEGRSTFRAVESDGRFRVEMEMPR